MNLDINGTTKNFSSTYELGTIQSHKVTLSVAATVLTATPHFHCPRSVPCAMKPAVISYVMKDGSECPIVFASKTLSASENNYSQIDKEVLSLIFVVTKFGSTITYMYIWPKVYIGN